MAIAAEPPDSLSAVTRLHRCVAAAATVLLGPGLASCTVGRHTVVRGPTVVTTTTTHAGPSPTTTIVRSYRTYRAGETGVLRSRAQHASLRITVSRPHRSTTRLSPSYGDAPLHGHYVTFQLTIANTGQVPVLLQRLDFWVRTPGAAKTTTDDGNSPYSGSGTELDTTQLVPGKRITNNLTFDVANPSGTLFYGPNGRKALAWDF